MNCRSFEGIISGPFIIDPQLNTEANHEKEQQYFVVGILEVKIIKFHFGTKSNTY
jgi:hypothetical protein